MMGNPMTSQTPLTQAAVRHSRPASGWAVLVVLAVTVASAIAYSTMKVGQLRDAVAERTARARRMSEVRKENEGLRNAQPASAEIARKQELALTQARAELEAARRRKESQRSSQAPVPVTRAASPETPPPARFAAGSIVPAEKWKNAGNATAEAALETALWAAAGGDVDALAANLVFPNATDHAAAQAAFDALPDEVRLRYRTPEQFVAAMTIPQVTMSEAGVFSWGDGTKTEAPFTAIKVVQGKFSNSSKATILLLGRQDDGWKLIVGSSVVAGYAAQLKGGAAQAK